MTSSFNKMRFGSNLGRAMPAPTSTSVPPRFSCASADSCARPLPEHSSATSNGSSTVSNGIAGCHEIGGVDHARAELLAERAPALLGLAHDDVVDAERLEGRDREEADRAAAGDEPAGPGPGAAALGDAVQRDREGFGERGVLEREVVGNVERLRRPARSCSAAKAPCQASLPATELRSMQSEVRLARQYSHLPHLGEGPPIARSPIAQPVTSAPIAATVPENSWPSIAPALPPHSMRKCRSEPQIPQWLTSSSSSPGPGTGVGPVLDRDVAQTHEDGRGHVFGDRRVGLGNKRHAKRVART